MYERIRMLADPITVAISNRKARSLDSRRPKFGPGGVAKQHKRNPALVSQGLAPPCDDIRAALELKGFP